MSEESNLSAPDILARLALHASKVESDETKGDGSRPYEPHRKGLTGLGAFDTRATILLTNCCAPSHGAVLCSIRIPGLGLVDLS